MKYNTGNPLGSADPRDLYDTATVADNLVHGEEPGYTDRLGKKRKSWAGMEKDFDEFLANSGYVGTGTDGAVEDYASGIEVTAYNQIIRDGGEFWRAAAGTELPYTTTGAGMSESGAFVAVGDAALRQELASTSPGQGASLVSMESGESVKDAVNKRTVFVGSVAELEALPSPTAEQEALVKGTPFKYNGTEWLPSSGYVDIAAFRAVPDWDGSTATDSSSQIQEAIDYAEQKGVKVIGSGEYGISDKVVIKCNADFSLATFYPLSNLPISLEISTGSSTDPTDVLFRKRIITPTLDNRANKTSLGWTGLGVGLRVVNTVECTLYISVIRDFKVNLLRTAFATAHAYNSYYLTSLLTGEVNDKIEPGDLLGYVNENSTYGGRYSYFGSEGENTAGARHIDIVDVSGGQTPNNNHWYSCSLEGAIPEDAVYCQGSYNSWVNCRWEGVNRVTFDAGPQSQGQENKIDGGYDAYRLIGLNKIQELNGASRNRVLSGRLSVIYGSSSDVAERYQNTTGNDKAAIGTYPSSVNMIASPEKWVSALTGQGVETKAEDDSFPAATLITSRLSVGSGKEETDTWLRRFGTEVWRSKGMIEPETDNTYSLGDAANRWSQVYAVNGTINTSDEREKEQQRDLSEAERRTAIALKGKIKAFKWKDSVREKGPNARWHFGVMAQELASTFNAEGLDARNYGMFCYDSWEDELENDGSLAEKSGDRYGVRYDQLMAFIVSAL